jgi:hypothetical protein
MAGGGHAGHPSETGGSRSAHHIDHASETLKENLRWATTPTRSVKE